MVQPHLAEKKITFVVVGQITQMNHQNNQEQKSHLCDGQCPHQIRLFATGGFRRPHQIFFFFFFFTTSVFFKLLRVDKIISAGPE